MDHFSRGRMAPTLACPASCSGSGRPATTRPVGSYLPSGRPGRGGPTIWRPAWSTTDWLTSSGSPPIPRAAGCCRSFADTGGPILNSAQPRYGRQALTWYGNKLLTNGYKSPTRQGKCDSTGIITQIDPDTSAELPWFADSIRMGGKLYRRRQCFRCSARNRCRSHWSSSPKTLGFG